MHRLHTFQCSGPMKRSSGADAKGRVVFQGSGVDSFGIVTVSARTHVGACGLRCVITSGPGRVQTGPGVMGHPAGVPAKWRSIVVATGRVTSGAGGDRSLPAVAVIVVWVVTSERVRSSVIRGRVFFLPHHLGPR